jgi:hypothetical protein
METPGFGAAWTVLEQASFDAIVASVDRAQDVKNMRTSNSLISLEYLFFCKGYVKNLLTSCGDHLTIQTARRYRSRPEEGAEPTDDGGPEP